MLNFSWATDLDPKGANNHIKDAIDRRYVTDDDEDVSTDASVCMYIYYAECRLDTTDLYCLILQFTNKRRFNFLVRTSSTLYLSWR